MISLALVRASFSASLTFSCAWARFFLAAVGSSEAFSDLLLALFDRVHQRRPDLGRDDPDQTSEGQRLRKKGEIDIHG